MNLRRYITKWSLDSSETMKLNKREVIMEGRYPHGLWVAFTDCTDPAQEIKFNQWYNEIYISHMENLGFVRNTRRYENLYGNEPTFRGRPKYLALSEIYRDNLKETLKEIRQSDAQLKIQGKDFSAM